MMNPNNIHRGLSILENSNSTTQEDYSRLNLQVSLISNGMQKIEKNIQLLTNIIINNQRTDIRANYVQESIVSQDAVPSSNNTRQSRYLIF